MTALEVALMIVGIIFLIVSFFVEDKLSGKDIDKIADLSESELRVIVDRNLRGAESQIEDSIEQSIEDAREGTKRALERETNEKIMAIDEFSNTVLDSMNRTHEEIIFLYNMLNDKHAELTGLAGQLQQFSESMRRTENEALANLAEAAKDLETKVREPQIIDEDEAVREALGQTDGENQADAGNHNDRILDLHREGVSDVEIAKKLGLGLGEVKLVIGLYKGEAAGEV